MREAVRWAVPGLVVAGPLHLLLARWHAEPPWPVWLIAAPVIGVVLHQGVRQWFEGRNNGFRSPHRAALAVIIERGNLASRPDRGDIAYQVYEIVFYQQPDWQAVRDHAHRCWDYIFLFWSTAVGAVIGAAISLLAFGTSPALALLSLLALALAAMVLWRKGRQTHAALELFDRALVLAHWPLYEGVLHAIAPDLGHRP